MALARKHDPHLEAPRLEAAAEVRRGNPLIGAGQQPMAEDEYAADQRERQELERVWDERDRERGGTTDMETGAQAVTEDRGR